VNETTNAKREREAIERCAPSAVLTSDRIASRYTRALGRPSASTGPSKGGVPVCDVEEVEVLPRLLAVGSNSRSSGATAPLPSVGTPGGSPPTRGRRVHWSRCTSSGCRPETSADVVEAKLTERATRSRRQRRAGHHTRRAVLPCTAPGGEGGSNHEADPDASRAVPTLLFVSVYPVRVEMWAGQRSSERVQEGRLWGLAIARVGLAPVSDAVNGPPAYKRWPE
jgi:hypothetical protein